MKPPEVVKGELVRQWLAKAEEDFGVARYLLAREAPYESAIAWHAQQAAEKLLKAVLVHHQVEFPKTHDLGDLVDSVAAVDSPLARLLGDPTALNPYGVEVRYPGNFPKITPEAAREAVDIVDKVRSVVLSTLKDYCEGEQS